MHMPPADRTAARADLTLADYTSPALVLANLRGGDVPAVIQELSAALQREGRIADVLPFYQAALNREYLCSTVVEPGWALPHVLVKGVDKPCFALGRAAPSIAWVGNNSPRVRLIFLFATPETDARAYMKLILGVARLNKETPLVDHLLRAVDPFDIFNVLRQVKIPTGRAA